MSVAEIVDSFTGWGYSLSPEQVARPTSDFILGVYTACLSRVTGITLEILQDASEQPLSSMDNSVRAPTAVRYLQCRLLTWLVQDVYSQALAHSLLLYHMCVLRVICLCKVAQGQTGSALPA